MNTEKTVWDFVQQHYPKYHSCAKIAENDDLQVLIDGEEEEGSKAWDLKLKMLSEAHKNNAFSIPNDIIEKVVVKRIEARYNESCKYIFEKAIEGYLESQKEKEAVTMTFSIADVDQAMEENDIDYPLTDHGKLEALRHTKENFDANASYWDNIVEGIHFVINKSNGVES